MDSTIAPLRPLTMPQLLDRAVRVFRDNFWVLLGIAAIAQIPVIIITVALNGNSTYLALMSSLADPFASPALGGNGFNSFGLNFLGTIVISLLELFGNGALVWAALNLMLGNKVSVGSAYRQMFSYGSSIAGLWFLTIVCSIALIIWTFLACVVGWFTGYGMIIFFTYIITPLALVVIMVEGESVWQALPRAWQLTRQRFWWVLFLVLFLTMLTQALILGPQALLGGGFGFVLLDSLSGFGTLSWLAIALSVVSMLLAMMILPIYWSGMAALYLDLRVRFEGVDLALQMRAVGDDTVSAEKPFAAIPKAPPKPAMPDRSEWGRFVVLTVGPFLLIIALYAILIGLFFALAGISGF